jgi:hypothetical protein
MNVIAADRGTTLTGMVGSYLETVASESAAAGRQRRERETLERSFERFQFKVGKRTWSGPTCMSVREFFGGNSRSRKAW